MSNYIKSCSLNVLAFALRPTTLLFSLSLFFISCSYQKKTTQAHHKCILDFKNPKTLSAHLASNEFRFDKLNAKLSIEALIDSISSSYTISLRIKKDSVIWMSISKLGIEGARVLITKDSVKFTTRIPGQSNKFFKGDFAYISKLLSTELDYEILQSLLVGSSVEFYDDDEKIKSGVDNCQYTLGTIRKYKLRKVMGKGKDLKEPAQIIYMEPRSYKITRILFYEFNPDRSFDARFNNYSKIDTVQYFPMEMNYIIKAKKNMIINLKYSKIALNEEQSFPFKIPDDYEQIIYKEK